MSERFLGGLAVIAMAALIAGCGGDDDGGGESTGASEAVTKQKGAQSGGAVEGGEDGGGPPTEDQYVARVDAVCERSNDEIARKVKDLPGEEGQQEEIVTEIVVPSLRRRAQEIAALEEPAGKKGGVDAMVEALEGAADELEENPSLMSKPGGGPLEETMDLARAYGLAVCSS